MRDDLQSDRPQPNQVTVNLDHGGMMGPYHR